MVWDQVVRKELVSIAGIPYTSQTIFGILSCLMCDSFSDETVKFDEKQDFMQGSHYQGLAP